MLTRPGTAGLATPPAARPAAPGPSPSRGEDSGSSHCSRERIHHAGEGSAIVTGAHIPRRQKDPAMNDATGLPESCWEAPSVMSSRPDLRARRYSRLFCLNGLPPNMALSRPTRLGPCPPTTHYRTTRCRRSSHQLCQQPSRGGRNYSLPARQFVASVTRVRASTPQRARWGRSGDHRSGRLRH